MWAEVFNLGQLKECTHSVAHRGLQRSVLFGLAADVVKGEQQVVVVGQIGRNLHLHLLVELRRPSGQGLNTTFIEDTVKEVELECRQKRVKR